MPPQGHEPCVLHLNSARDGKAPDAHDRDQHEQGRDEAAEHPDTKEYFMRLRMFLQGVNLLRELCATRRDGRGVAERLQH
mmetsp:Transcript_20011/g.40358  ORF Transcript_20011/g.40358 Transcript_20011/m.40358 type:complete len:80 (+) Transcript_20011:456-695(+)